MPKLDNMQELTNYWETKGYGISKFDHTLYISKQENYYIIINLKKKEYIKFYEFDDLTTKKLKLTKEEKKMVKSFLKLKGEKRDD